jgi:hypothetical protein
MAILTIDTIEHYRLLYSAWCITLRMLMAFYEPFNFLIPFGIFNTILYLIADFFVLQINLKVLKSKNLKPEEDLDEEGISLSN